MNQSLSTKNTVLIKGTMFFLVVTIFLILVWSMSVFNLMAFEGQEYIQQHKIEENKDNWIKPAKIFQSHMVLQQEKSIKIWGTANPGNSFKVQLGFEKHQVESDVRGDWEVTFSSLKASFEPIQLIIGDIVLDDILIGELWICSGQSNMVRTLEESDGGMEAYKSSTEDAIRLLRLNYPPLVAKSGYEKKDLDRCNVTDFFKGNWSLNNIEEAGSFSAIGWMFGKQISDDQKVPAGLIQLAVGGAAINNWISPQALKSELETKNLFTKDWLLNEDVDLGHRNRCKDAFQKVLKPGENYIVGKTQYRWMCEPGFLFEAGIAPIKNLNFKGVIWYQGENDAINESSTKRYRTLFPLLVYDWRKHFENGNFPFIYVQLPRFGKDTWPEFREIQRRSLENIPNSYMAVIIDLGEENNIHPIDKLPVGQRLASLAIKNVYNSKKDRNTFPEIIKIEIEKNITKLTLNEKIIIKDRKNIPGFELADQNGKFYTVKAYSTKERRIEIKFKYKPTAIRYGWMPFPTPSLEIFDEKGYPLGPFMLKF